MGDVNDDIINQIVRLSSNTLRGALSNHRILMIRLKTEILIKDIQLLEKEINRIDDKCYKVIDSFCSSWHSLSNALYHMDTLNMKDNIEEQEINKLLRYEEKQQKYKEVRNRERERNAKKDKPIKPY